MQGSRKEFRRARTFSCLSVILLVMKKEVAVVLNLSKMEGVRLPFSKIGASFPPMNVVRGARPGIEGTEVEDMMFSKEESGDSGMFATDCEQVLVALLGGIQEVNGGGFGMVFLCALVARLRSGRTVGG